MAERKGKPAPDIFLLALERINEALSPNSSRSIGSEECLVLEDSTAGVEAARKAGMRVVWVPHPKLREVYCGSERVVLEGRTDELLGGVPPPSAGDSMKEGQASEQCKFRTDDGFAEMLSSLDLFDYQRYGLEVLVV